MRKLEDGGTRADPANRQPFSLTKESLARGQAGWVRRGEKEQKYQELTFTECSLCAMKGFMYFFK